jgi:hypothetical protein
MYLMPLTVLYCCLLLTLAWWLLGRRDRTGYAAAIETAETQTAQFLQVIAEQERMLSKDAIKQLQDGNDQLRLDLHSTREILRALVAEADARDKREPVSDQAATEIECLIQAVNTRSQMNVGVVAPTALAPG